MGKTKYKNIIISGDVGTGTSTLGKALAEKLSWEFLSTGDFFRQYFIEHNIPLWDKSSIPNEVEKKVDYELFDKIKNEQGLVVDSHYAAWFSKDIPDVFRILLVCDEKTVNERILKRVHTHKETVAEIEERRKQLHEKFTKLYSNENYLDPKFFNLVIDTGKNNIPQTIELALKGLNRD